MHTYGEHEDTNDQQGAQKGIFFRSSAILQADQEYQSNHCGNGGSAQYTIGNPQKDGILTDPV